MCVFLLQISDPYLLAKMFELKNSHRKAGAILLTRRNFFYRQRKKDRKNSIVIFFFCFDKWLYELLNISLVSVCCSAHIFVLWTVVLRIFIDNVMIC